MVSDSPGVQKVVSGNKIIFANTLTVHGDFNAGTGAKHESPLELLSFKCEDGLLDASFRNKNPSSCLINKLNIIVDEIQLLPEDVQYRLLPVTYQYHMLLSLDQSAYQMDLSQEVPSAGLDRFQIIIALGRMEGSAFRDGPWGYQHR